MILAATRVSGNGGRTADGSGGIRSLEGGLRLRRGNPVAAGLGVFTGRVRN